jgi:hypothetical protein
VEFLFEDGLGLDRLELRLEVFQLVCAGVGATSSVGEIV